MFIHLERLPNYLKAFGPISGFAAFCRIHMQPHGGTFSIKFAGQRVFLRPTPSDTSIFFQIFVKREYDSTPWQQHTNLQHAYRAILNEGRIPVIIDAGANIGLSALWFSDRYPEAIIYAIEPDRANMAILEQNVSGRERIIPLHGAIWDRPAKLRIMNPEAGSGAFRVAEGEGDLRAYSVPEIVSMRPRGKLLIAKIDIEGGEKALFRSNTGWMRDAEMITIELHDWLFPGEHTSKNFLTAAASMSVDFVFRGENVFCFKGH